MFKKNDDNNVNDVVKQKIRPFYKKSYVFSVLIFLREKLLFCDLTMYIYFCDEMSEASEEIG